MASHQRTPSRYGRLSTSSSTSMRSGISEHVGRHRNSTLTWRPSARPEEEISSHAGSFEEAIIVRRPALVSPAGGEAATAKQKDAGKKASGFRPYMLELDKHLANTKKALGRKNGPRRNERSQGEFQALVRQPRGQLQLRRGLRLVDAVWH